MNVKPLPVLQGVLKDLEELLLLMPPLLEYKLKGDLAEESAFLQNEVTGAAVAVAVAVALAASHTRCMSRHRCLLPAECGRFSGNSSSSSSSSSSISFLSPVAHAASFQQQQQQQQQQHVSDPSGVCGVIPAVAVVAAAFPLQ